MLMLRVLLIFIFFCLSFFIKLDYSLYNKFVSNSLTYIAETKQKTVLSVKTEEYFISANTQNKTEIKNQSNKTNNFWMSFGCINLNQLNIFKKFVIYKNKLSFGYVLYRILNNLRNSIYPNAP